jgi:5-methylcytosine-specific restriction endonuclease McrA
MKYPDTVFAKDKSCDRCGSTELVWLYAPDAVTNGKQWLCGNPCYGLARTAYINELLVKEAQIKARRAVSVSKVSDAPISEDSEDHTAKKKHDASLLKELQDLAKYAAKRSSHDDPTPPYVLPSAEKVSVEPVLLENNPIPEAEPALIGVTSEEITSSPTEIPDELSVTFPKFVHTVQYKPLTEEERSVGRALGLLKEEKVSSKPEHSVLDAFPAISKAGKHPKEVSKALLIRQVVSQQGCCAYCDRKFGSVVIVDGKMCTLRPELDHASPKALRMNNSPSNLLAADQVCNSLKSSRVFSTLLEARDTLQKAWEERGWYTAPLLVPFKSTMSMIYN